MLRPEDAGDSVSKTEPDSGYGPPVPLTRDGVEREFPEVCDALHWEGEKPSSCIRGLADCVAENISTGVTCEARGSRMELNQLKSKTVGWSGWRLTVLLIFASVSGLAAEAPAPAEKPDGWVERAIFTTAVENHEPVDTVAILPETEEQVFFFTDLRGLQGRTVTHRWEYQGKVMAEVSFEVKGPRWRVFSVKSLDSGQLGKWTAIVVDESGWPLRAAIFQYGAPGVTDVSRSMDAPPPVFE